MTDPVTQAQLVLMARTLHVSVEELQDLERLGATNLGALREQISKVISDDQAEIFKRVTTLVSFVPMRIAMPLVEKIVPPMVAGRAGAAIAVAHPKKAVAAMTAVKVPYAAEAAQHIDPRAGAQLAGIAPPDRVVEIANEVLARRDYATAGLFLDVATPELVEAVEAGVPDDEGLLRAASFALSGEAVSNIVRIMVEAKSPRVPRMIEKVVNGDTDLRLAALSVLSRCSADVVTRGGDILFDQLNSETIADLLHECLREGAAPALLQFAGHLSPSALELVAVNLSTEDQAVVSDLFRAAAENGQPQVWRGLFVVLERTNESVQQQVIGLVADLDGGPSMGLAHAATDEHLWPVLLRMMAKQDADLQSKIATSLGPSLDEVDLASLERHIGELRLDQALTPVVSALAKAVR